MTEVWNNFLGLFQSQGTANVLRAVILLVTGFAVARFVARGVARMVRRRTTDHQTLLVRRGVFTLVLTLFVATVLNQLGFRLSVLLGAAGILSVAAGFAAQTSASNLISGLFLLYEQPFSVGDVVRVGSTTGKVLSIDLLSVKIQTFDNLFVRIPNETLINSEIHTVTKFPIRRIDILLGVAYREDIPRVRDVLMEVAESNPLALAEPPPLFIFRGFGESSLDLQFSVWVKQENFLDLRNSVQEGIKQAFDLHGIEIPFPHRTLYTGSETTPLPVKIVTEPGGESQGSEAAAATPRVPRE